MKKRKLLSAVLAASLLASTVPATAWASEPNTEPVATEQASARSSEDWVIDGGQAGTDYTIEDDVVTIRTSTHLTFGGENQQYNVKVPEGVTANVTLAATETDSADISIRELPAGSILNLSQTGDYHSSSVNLKDDNLSNFNGKLVINDTDGYGNYYLYSSYDIYGDGSVVVNNGNVNVNVNHWWDLKDFTIYQGNINLSFNDQYCPLRPENFTIYGGEVDFNLESYDWTTAVDATNCTITGGNIAVRNQQELDDNIFQDTFWGIVGADAELERYDHYDNNGSQLIQADKHRISGGCFYEAELSANTVYGMPVNAGMTLDVEPSDSQQHGDRYAVYHVVRNNSVSHLKVSGEDYEQNGRIVTLKDGADVTVSSSEQTSDRIIVENGATATLHLQGVEMLGSEAPISLDYNSNLTLVLDDYYRNNIKTIGELGSAAIETQSSSELVIRGTGELNATGSEGGAAIGASEMEGGYATIKIEDGVINAQGGADAAGVGGGVDSRYMSIEIFGGEIRAEGQTGIGDGTHSRDTRITITGGDIVANGGDGAGIGGGYGSTVDSISIEGGNIEASGASGIGTGNGLWVNNRTYNSTIDYISIYGGNIHANGSAGIGGGRSMNGALTSVGGISIGGGTVEAYGGAYGIGAGQGGIGGTLDCYGAVIRANSISDMAHKENWSGIFFVNTINHGQGTLLGDYVWLNDDAVLEYDYLEIKDGQELAIGEYATLTLRYGSIDVQSGGRIFNGGTLFNEEGDITVYPGGVYEEYGKGTFEGWPEIEFIGQEQPDETAVTGVQLSKEKMTLQLGKSKRLTATVLPENAANKNVTWSSSDKNIAKVNKNGRVTAVAEGTAVITVTTEDGGYMAECTVKVTKNAAAEVDVESVSLNKTSLELKAGTSETLTATVAPENATDKSTQWLSSNTQVVAVEQSGKIKALNEGTATITVMTIDGNYTAECIVTVTKADTEPVAATGVSLNKTALELKTGADETLTATVAPENATNKTVNWTSSNTNVATVDATGKVTAAGNGTAVITASTVDGGFTAQCTVTVSEDKPEIVAVENVTLNKTSASLEVGETEQLTATVKPADAANKSVRWKSNDENVVSVDANGKLTAISSGMATVTVTTEEGNFTALCKVTVTNPDDTTTDTETQPDGSTVTTVEDVNGSSSSTTVDTNGVSTTTVSLSETVIDQADRNDMAVTLPMVGVTAATDIDAAPSVTVDLPTSGATKVEIPVLDMTPGTVAVLVDADGNETVIPNSVLGNNGLIVTLEDGDTVKIFDNTQSYGDVAASHWAKDNIDYVTSRGLFVGVDDANFAPETSMTRAMIVSVLQRYAGDTTAAAPGSDWYEGARQWAIAHGISDGTNMNGNVTREQLVTMLYRYIGSPQIVGSLSSYSDNASVSPYAEQAMVWAVRNGIIGGMTADTLAPQGMATRAQVAAILERFIAWEQA